MPENRNKLTFHDVKGFFSSLSVKEYCGIAARSILFSFCLISLLQRGKIFGMQDADICFSIIVLSGAFFLFPPFLFTLFYLPFLLLLFVDFHLFRSYGLSVSAFGYQLFAILLDTNTAEVVEYLARITFSEWAMMMIAAAVLACVFLYKRKATVIPKKQRAFVLLFILFWYPFSYAGNLYPFVRGLFTREEVDTIARNKAFRFNPVKGENKADTVVVLIGESHRQAEFAPAFDHYADRFQTLYRFSDMISPFATTLQALPIVLSRKKTGDAQKFFPEKSLFSLFGEAGYDTYFMHYVKMSAEGGLTFIYRDADRFIKYADRITPTTDEGILPFLDDVLADEKRKKLIVIKMIGVHINFDYRYPDPELSGLRRKLADMQIKTKEREMHHYRKAMDYSVGIIEKIMERIENRPEPAMLFFTSDHGICIFDKDSFHMPPDCRNAFHIPAMVLLNPALSATTSQQAKDNLSCNQNKPLTEEYDFETIASLAGISYPSADPRYDLTKKCFHSTGKKRPVFVIRKKTFYEDL